MINQSYDRLKKILVTFSFVVLLSTGCNSSRQVYTQTPAIQNTNSTSTASSVDKYDYLCKDAVTESALSDCSYRQSQAAEQELNKVYSSWLEKETDPAIQNQIKAAQNLWLQYRDKECAAEGADYKGGSVQPLIINNCIRSITEQRTQLLSQ